MALVAPETAAAAATAESGFGRVIRNTIFSGLSPSKVSLRNSPKRKSLSEEDMLDRLTFKLSA